jgi:predicted nucleotidyltransferase
MRLYRKYVEAWEKRGIERQKELARRKEKAAHEAMRLVRILVQEYGVQQVYIFGSLVQDDSFLTETSDIDLAVCGLNPKLYFRALGRIQDATKFGVDLVTMESCADGLREAILKEGRLLYDGRAKGKAKAS